MAGWNTIDLDSAFKKVNSEGNEQDNNDFEVQDENGNNLVKEKIEITTDGANNKKEEIVVGDNKENTKDEAALKAAQENEKQHKSRAQDRIRQVIRERKEAEEKWKQRVELLEAQLADVSRESLGTQKQFIDARIAETKKALSRAQEEGKFDEAANYMADLSDLQTKKIVADSTIERQEKESKRPSAKQTSQQQQEDDFDDTEMLGWIGRNKDWWQKDNLKTTLAVRLSKKIDKEGILTPDDSAYYDELDERLKEILKEDTTTETRKDLSSSDKEEASTKKPPQTSSGASRTSAVSKSSDGKKLVINLTANERAMAKKLGISEIDWAKQKYRQQKSKDEHGYTVINGDA